MNELVKQTIAKKNIAELVDKGKKGQNRTKQLRI